MKLMGFDFECGRNRERQKDRHRVRERERERKGCRNKERVRWEYSKKVRFVKKG